VVQLARALSAAPAGVFVTTVTATGRTAAARALPDVPVSFAPLDFVPAVRRVIASRRPRALLLTETELWPNTVHECLEAGVPVGMVNGRLSEKSLRRFSMSGSPMRSLAPRLSFAACRSEEDAGRYRRLGVPAQRVRVVGDVKFDKLAEPMSDRERAELRSSLGAAPDAATVVFGSVRPKEESGVAEAAASVVGAVAGARVVVAPRHLERVQAIRRELESQGLSTALRSAGPADEADAIVLDTTGELAAVYGTGRVAFVGGTLAPYGGHDPLEPAAQGVPVVVGPHTETCRESARRLIDAGGAFEVHDAPGLADTMLRLLADGDARAAAGESALRAVTDGRGATERTIAFLEELGVIDAASR
jgi:3-deoxy-D-manno-octulosonic-acid transferase